MKQFYFNQKSPKDLERSKHFFLATKVSNVQVQVWTLDRVEMRTLQRVMRVCRDCRGREWRAEPRCGGRRRGTKSKQIKSQ